MTKDTVRCETPPSERCDPRRHVADFADPLTRMLLVSDGFTTPVLEALLGTRLQVRVLRQDLVPSADIPDDLSALLRLNGRGEVLVRRSCLVDPDLSPVSSNQVIAATPAANGHLNDDITSLTTPIGYSLLGRGVAQRREIVHIGRSTWSYGGRSEPCAVKAYVMLIDDEPWCYIRECFNPRHVPCTPTASGQPRSHNGPLALISSSGDDLALPASDRTSPPLVTPRECRTLTTHLADTVTGGAVMLHLGDSGETSNDRAASRIQARQALLAVGAAVLGLGTGRPVVALQRIEDQYFHAAATLNFLRAHPTPSAEAIRAITTEASQALHQCGPPGTPSSGDMAHLICEVDQLLAAAVESPARSRRLHTLVPAAYSSHTISSHTMRTPAYDQALTHRTVAGEQWSCAAHLLWLSGRTWDSLEPHVHFAAGIRNPIAVELGPSTRPEDVAKLCALLNPERIPGRLTLATGLGASQVRDLLPPLLEAAADVPVTWVCDPMRGNTRTTDEGREFCGLDGVAEEIRAFFGVHRDCGTVAGGIHLKAAGEADLNPAQTLECILLALSELRRQVSARKPPPNYRTS